MPSTAVRAAFPLAFQRLNKGLVPNAEHCEGPEAIAHTLWIQLLSACGQRLSNRREELRRGCAQLGKGPGCNGQMLSLPRHTSIAFKIATCLALAGPHNKVSGEHLTWSNTHRSQITCSGRGCFLSQILLKQTSLLSLLQKDQISGDT